MNQNMFSLIKQIGYWLPMLRKALSNKIQVTKKEKEIQKPTGKQGKNSRMASSTEPNDPRLHFLFQKKRKRNFKPDVLSLSLLPILFSPLSLFLSPVSCLSKPTLVKAAAFPFYSSKNGSLLH